MSDYRKPDFWTKKAIAEKYPARSVYKLEEMQKQFKLFPAYGRVLDLGAAPGSWTQFVLRNTNEHARVTAVDLKPLANDVSDSRLTFFCGDMEQKSIVSQVTADGYYHSILCDAAPATTGNKIVDTARSEALVEIALFYAETVLLPHGNTVIKIFQGGNQGNYLRTMRKFFKTARAFKPKACRAASIETYLLGLGFMESRQ